MIVTLKELGDISTGNTPSKKINDYYDSNDIYFVKPDIISNSEISIISNSSEYISEKAREKARIVPKDSIFVTCIGTIGKIGIASDGEFAFNQQINTIKPNDSIVPKYLAYNLFHSKARLNAISNAPVVPIINKSQFSEFTIKIETDKSKQQKIAATLDKLQSIITHRRTQLEKLDLLVKARFVEMFGDPVENPHKYPIIRYGDLFELNAGGTPSKAKPEYWENGTISWIGSNMCQNTIIYENDGKYITQQGYDNSSAKMFPVDTVLIALVGATIGKTALLKFETSTNQNVLGVRGIAKAGYNPLFVYYYTQFLYSKFMNIGDGGFNMASKSFVSELPMYEIDIHKQSLFAEFAKKTDKSKVAVHKELDKAQMLFDSLMQEYFG